MEETKADDHPMEVLLPTSPLAFYVAHKGEIDAAIANVLSRGWYILGREADAFDQEFAHYLAVRHAVGVASGTDALHLALRAGGIGAGDAVLASVELHDPFPLRSDLYPP